MTMSLIETVTVGSGGAANITFSNIPQDADDLLLVFSLRITFNGVKDDTYFRMNSFGSNGARALQGNGSATSSNTSTRLCYTNAATSTSNTFTSGQIYIPNYKSTSVKSYASESAHENNATEAYQYLVAGSGSTTSAVTSLEIYGNNFVQHSSASLYKITKA